MNGPKVKGGAPTGPPRGTEEDPHKKDTTPPSNAPKYRELAGGPVPASYRITSPEARARDREAWPRSARSAPPSRSHRRPPLDATGLLADPYAMKRVPTRILTGERFRNAMLDHREGFIVSLVDGELDVESIVDVCGMPADDVLEILEGLRLSGVLSLE